MTQPADTVSHNGRETGPPPTFGPRVSVQSLSLSVLAGVAVIYLLHWAQQVFVPIVLGVLISYALEPIVLFFKRLRLPRTLSSALVVTSLATSFGYATYALSDDVAAIAAELPAAAVKLRTSLRQERRDSTIDNVQRAAAELQRTADEATAAGPSAQRGVQRVQIEQPAINVRDYLSWGSANLVTFAGQGVLVMFFVFFLLASGDLFKRKLVKLVGPSLEKKKITVQILDDINSQIERFLFVRVLTSVVVGVSTWAAFRMAGLEQAGVWGMAAGTFSSIPYFGPLIVAAGAGVVALLQFGTISMAAWIGGISLAITSLEGWILTPWLTSRTARTNEVAVFVGLIFWGFVWGIWGTMLAVPLLVAIKACCDRIEDLKPVGELLGE